MSKALKNLRDKINKNFEKKVNKKVSKQQPSRQDQKVSMIPGPYGYTDEYKGGLK